MRKVYKSDDNIVFVGRKQLKGFFGSFFHKMALQSCGVLNVNLHTLNELMDNGVNQTIGKKIIKGRPFLSLEDFHKRIPEVDKDSMVCF